MLLLMESGGFAGTLLARHRGLQIDKRLGSFSYRPLPCVTCIAQAAIGVSYTPVGSCQTRSTRSFGLAADGYVRGRCCLYLGLPTLRPGRFNNQPSWPVIQHHARLPGSSVG